MNLHGKIMNIPANIEGLQNPSRSMYKTGHRDARHSAAEMAIKYDQFVDHVEELITQHYWDDVTQLVEQLTMKIEEIKR